MSPYNRLCCFMMLLSLVGRVKVSPMRSVKSQTQKSEVCAHANTPLQMMLWYNCKYLQMWHVHSQFAMDSRLLMCPFPLIWPPSTNVFPSGTHQSRDNLANQPHSSNGNLLTDGSSLWSIYYSPDGVTDQLYLPVLFIQCMRRRREVN